MALYDELVLVDQRRCGGAVLAEPGRGAGGKLPPERMESASPLLLQALSVMPPHDELVLGAREVRVEGA